MLSMNFAHSRQRTPYIPKKTELLIPGSVSLRHLIQLNRELVSNLTPKRRCSSHTFRYGYLVTT